MPHAHMSADNTAILLIGFQRDYFDDDGVLAGVIEENGRREAVVRQTLGLLDWASETTALIVSAPIYFTDDYSELVDPQGILKTIVEVGAFREGTTGSQTIAPLVALGERIVEVPGKRGLDAFSNTGLDDLLLTEGIRHLVLAGVVSSLCIDSTARRAFELNYRVTILSDCCGGRTQFEERFYTERIFPLYADVITSDVLITRMEPGLASDQPIAAAG